MCYLCEQDLGPKTANGGQLFVEQLKNNNGIDFLFYVCTYFDRKILHVFSALHCQPKFDAGIACVGTLKPLSVSLACLPTVVSIPPVVWLRRNPQIHVGHFFNQYKEEDEEKGSSDRWW